MDKNDKSPEKIRAFSFKSSLSYSNLIQIYDQKEFDNILPNKNEKVENNDENSEGKC